jgi:hypothetical protein
MIQREMIELGPRAGIVCVAKLIDEKSAIPEQHR